MPLKQREVRYELYQLVHIFVSIVVISRDISLLCGCFSSLNQVVKHQVCKITVEI